jgi:predicted nucleic acid-binding Zn ribbon protein
MSQDPAAKEQLAKRSWAAAVGKKLAGRTKAAKLVRGTLVVEVEDFIWQKQLFTLRAQILDKMTAAIGSGIVEDVEFRIGVPRRMPQREERAASPQATLWDTADEIADPVLRRVYKVARRKALA